jgi:elongation factor G
MPGRSTGTRTIVLVGAGGSGKTSLAEALLHAAGAIGRQGSVADGTSIGDASPEARARGGSTEINLMHFEFLGDRFAVIDCPGSIGFAADGSLALAAADLALVVVDPDPQRAILAEPTLRQLEALGVPHMIFVNKIDQAHGSIQDLLEAMQPMSASPLVARQIPIADGERVQGFVDLALERAYYYRPGQASEQKEIPPDLMQQEASERFHMLEQLADHDDALLEQLLMDEVPDRKTVCDDLARETAQGQIVPVLFGSAQNGFGVRRLMKAFRHEAPEPSVTAERLGAKGGCAFVFKISHGGAMGRIALARIFGGPLKEGAELNGPDGDESRIGTLFAAQGEKTTKLPEARIGDVVGIAKLEGVHAGDRLTAGAGPPARRAGAPPAAPTPAPHTPPPHTPR